MDIACNLSALTAAEKIRHFIILGPALRARQSGTRELDDGYEFSFAPDAKTLTVLAEWAEQERRCCPFFDMDVRVSLRLTGRKGTKEFVRAEFAPWFE